MDILGKKKEEAKDSATTLNQTQPESKPQTEPSAEEGGKTTNTAMADQKESATTTDLDRLTQHQTGDNEATDTTGNNARQASEATDSLTRTSGLDQAAADLAKETADRIVEQRLDLQNNASGLTDAGGNFVQLDPTLLSTESDVDTYTSHPTKSLKLGRFQFENGTLTLKGDDKAEFAELLEAQPVFVRSGVKKIDSNAAAKLAKSYIDQNSQMTRGIDTAGNGPKSGAVGSSL